jgi:hypothetical protein
MLRSAGPGVIVAEHSLGIITEAFRMALHYRASTVVAVLVVMALLGRLTVRAAREALRRRDCDCAQV